MQNGFTETYSSVSCILYSWESENCTDIKKAMDQVRNVVQCLSYARGGGEENGMVKQNEQKWSSSSCCASMWLSIKEGSQWKRAQRRQACSSTTPNSTWKCFFCCCTLGAEDHSFSIVPTVLRYPPTPQKKAWSCGAELSGKHSGFIAGGLREIGGQKTLQKNRSGSQKKRFC